ncbi:MAG: ribosome recycling factor [Patescibacteria group bacterium]
MHSLSGFKEKVKGVEDWLRRELSGIRTGRATPAILDGVMVKAYGGERLPVSHLASVAVEDARTLRVTPWDKAQVKEIEIAIGTANLGVSVAADGSGLRIIFPSLTEENRGTLVKLVSKKLEEARISLRREREEVWNEIQDKEKTGEISEDAKFKGKTELQKLVDEANAGLEKVAATKETEIRG